jgi:hypothetical protein
LLSGNQSRADHSKYPRQGISDETMNYQATTLSIEGLEFEHDAII